MSETNTLTEKEQLIEDVKNLKIFGKKADLDNLTIAQLKRLVSVFGKKKEELIDEMVENKTIKAEVKGQLKEEVIKRRKAEQSCARLKKIMTAKAESIMEAVKAHK